MLSGKLMAPSLVELHASLEAAVVSAPVFRTGRRNGPATGSRVSCRRRVGPPELHSRARQREAATAWGGICDEAKSGRIRGRVCIVADARLPGRRGAEIGRRSDYVAFRQS